MPCSDGNPEWNGRYPSEMKATKEKLAKVEAFLCGVMTVLEKTKNITSVLNLIDYKEGGFKMAEFEEWWIEHKREDETRRENEKKATLARIAQLEKQANQTLSEVAKLKSTL